MTDILEWLKFYNRKSPNQEGGLFLKFIQSLFFNNTLFLSYRSYDFRIVSSWRLTVLWTITRQL